MNPYFKIICKKKIRLIMPEKITFSKRFAALFIDFLIIIVLSVSIGLPLGTSIRSSESQKLNSEIPKNEPEKTLPQSTQEPVEIKNSNENPFLNSVTGSIEKVRFGFEFGLGLIGLLYGLIEAFTAASPGKMIINFLIMKDNKTILIRSTLFLRYLTKNLSFFLFLIAGIWILPIFERAAIVIALILFIGLFRAMTDEGKTLLDNIFNTIVLDKNNVTTQNEIIKNID
jgi:hypothetical protein